MLKDRIRAVQSRQNSRVKSLRAAFDRPGHQEVVALEGEHLLREAVRSKLSFEAVFVIAGSEEWLASIELPEDVEILSLPPEVFASAVSTDSPQPFAALVRPPAFAIESLATAANPLVIVAAGLQDPGNLGSLIRSAEAFGSSGLIALPGTVSRWNPKALRASSGSAFRLPVVTCDAHETVAFLRSHSIRILAAVASHAVQGAAIGDFRGPSAIMIGNEGAGLSPERIAMADALVSIPCPGVTESLNAAIAGSILLYETWRQRAGR